MVPLITNYQHFRAEADALNELICAATDQKFKSFEELMQEARKITEERHAEAAKPKCVICSQATESKCNVCGDPLCGEHFCGATHKEKHFKPIN